ncbi:hypothetical protein ACIBSW_16225 [Actinoplanes sp. NPDC049668]|uniref:hypothetical protein n=1 Tax=unclassified Actinoplanes TaxID=2626549 RepID=UPI0033BE3471
MEVRSDEECRRLAWALSQLLLAVARLALTPELQRDYLRRSGVGDSADELGLELDDAAHQVGELEDAGWITPERAAAVRRIDGMLSAMSDAPNAALWEPEALSAAPEWAEVRAAAGEFLLSP